MIGKLLAYDGELNISRANSGTILVDVLHPLVVALESVCRDTDDLHISLLEVLGTTSNLSKLSCAYWGEITRMREQDSPGVADPLVEFDRACCGLSFEIRSNVSKAERRHFSL